MNDSLQPKGASVPGETADGPIVSIPLGQLETLRRAITLRNLHPGEGEALIDCWILASRAEMKP